MKLYFITYGPTTCHKLGIISGQRIIDFLSNDGVAHAQSIHTSLPSDISAIHSSDLERAKDTARIIHTNTNIPFSCFPELREIDFGNLSGRKYTDLNLLAPQGMSGHLFSHTYDYLRHGGESVQKVTERLQTYINKLKQEHNGKNILVVTHANIIRLMKYLNGQKSDTSIDSKTIYEFTF